jgi:hypothetical protein
VTNRMILKLAERPDTKSFSGDFMLTFRVRKRSFADAEAVAQQLLQHFPDETFYIDRQVARVKLKPQDKAA